MKGRRKTIRWDSASCPERLHEELARRVDAAWDWVRRIPQSGHPRDGGYRPIPSGYTQELLDHLVWAASPPLLLSSSLDLIGSFPEVTQERALDYLKKEGRYRLVPTLRKVFARTRELLGEFYITGVQGSAPRCADSFPLDSLNLAALLECSVGVGADRPEQGAP